LAVNNWCVGKEKLAFGDRINLYNSSMKKLRRAFLLTDQAVYIIAIEKNKDKDKIARQKKPWIYLLERRLENSKLRTVIMSTCADNFFLLNIPGEYDSLCECRRKTEFLCTFLKYNSNCNFQFSDT
jgi:hypothetical protein